MLKPGSGAEGIERDPRSFPVLATAAIIDSINQRRLGTPPADQPSRALWRHPLRYLAPSRSAPSSRLGTVRSGAGTTSRLAALVPGAQSTHIKQGFLGQAPDRNLTLAGVETVKL